MTERTFIPGSHWLYFKLETGQKSADEILISYIYPLVIKLKETSIIQNFFFIRYYDPTFHLRVRFFIKNLLYYGYIFNAIYEAIEPCVQKGLIYNVQCDTYRRELERYGVFAIDIVEQIFGIDSISQLKLLRIYNDKSFPDNDRWLISLRLISDCLDAFGYDLEQKVNQLSLMSDYYQQEFGFTQHMFTKQLNNKYRLNQQHIIKSFEYPHILEDVLQARKRMLTSHACHLLEMENKNILEKPLTDIVFSLLHMTMNRWFRSHNRIYELVIYNFLFKYYKSEQIKNRFK